MVLTRRAVAILTGAAGAFALVHALPASASTGSMAPTTNARSAATPASTGTTSTVATTTTTPVSGSPAAKALLARAMAAIKTEKGFRTLSVESSGNMVLTLLTAAGTNRGWQTVKLTGQAQGTEALTVLLMGPTAYLKGNKAGLANYMRFTAAAAGGEAGSWIGSTSASSSKVETYFYQSLAAGLTVKTAASEIQLVGKLSMGADTMVHGLRVHDIKMFLTHGQQVAHGDLYVRATGKPLPVYESVIASTGVHDEITTSNWGQEPTVNVPKKFVPVELGWLDRSAWG